MDGSREVGCRQAANIGNGPGVRNSVPWPPKSRGGQGSPPSSTKRMSTEPDFEPEALAKKVRAQLTAEMLDRLYALGEREIRRVRRAGISGPEDGADLVQKMLLHTLTGRVRWRPERMLEEHIADLVRHAGRRMRATARRHLPLSEVVLENDGLLELGDVAADALLVNGDAATAYELRRLSSETVSLLRAVVAEQNDPDLDRVFDAVVNHRAGTPKAIAAVTNMELAEARRVWRRLRALATTRLPDRLRAETLVVLRGDDLGKHSRPVRRAPRAR